jgi:TRAP-type transport system periplasmic protein
MAPLRNLSGGVSRVTAFGVRALAFVVLIFMTAAVSIGPSSAEPIKLNMVGAWAPGISLDADIAMRFMNEVNKNGKGKVEIVYKGSKEVVPTFDQPEALVRGVFDVWYGAPNYWAGVVPGGYITEMAKNDLPDNGPGSDLFNFMVKMYEAKGVRYLGHFAGDAGTGAHYMYVQKEISSMADLKGLKIRVPPLTRFFVEAVGGEPVTLPPSDVYVAVDRGTVDGFTWPYFDGFTNFGWQKITKFIIDEPLYRNGVGINVNLDKWNSLPKDVQDIMTEAVRTTQYWAMGWIAAHQTSQLQIMIDSGMKKLALSDAESKQWAKIANDSMWAHFKSVMSESDYTEARKLLGYE